MLKLTNVTTLYKNKRGIRRISMQFEKGDVVGLLGPNGSGKTTLMKTILSLTKPNSGSIEIFGKKPETDLPYIMRRVGALIEAPALYKDMNAYQNMVLASKGRPDKEEIDRLLRLVRMEQYKNERVSKFSLGMKQRLGLAIAFLDNPELVVLDEPVNGLDIEGVAEVRELITNTAREKGKTFLISSHIASELERCCNKVAVIIDGEMVAFRNTDDVLREEDSLESYFFRLVKEKRGELVI
ncbi:MAG: ATP-binding cassette domain-containing protein [bacterium]|nr:ATP-binding cassette domain-containing protein [bacterium]